MDFSLTYESIIRYIRIGIDILVVWILINYIIKAAKASQRTIQIFQGVIFILVVQALARLVGLTTVEWITNNIVSWGFLAIIVVFQPEIRSILERLGKSNAFARISVLSATEKERLVDELVAATANLSNSKTGALITLEQSHSLNEYIMGSFQRDFTMTIPLDGGNVGGIDMMSISPRGVGNYGTIGNQLALQTQIKFDKPIPKDNTNSIRFVIRAKWSRH